MNQEYTVLLILTDGIINDMGATIDSLVTASRLPLSVIIVGVGDAAFDQMEVGGRVGKRVMSHVYYFTKYSRRHDISTYKIKHELSTSRIPTPDDT